MDFAAQIKNLRESRRLSQQYMASQLNISQASYSRIESRMTQPTLAKIVAIAEALGVDVSELMHNMK